MGDKCNRDNNWCRTFYWDRGGAKWPRFGTTPHKFLTKIHSKCKADSWVYPQGVRECVANAISTFQTSPHLCFSFMPHQVGRVE